MYGLQVMDIRILHYKLRVDGWFQVSALRKLVISLK
jgi:hypothetical protein